MSVKAVIFGLTLGLASPAPMARQPRGGDDDLALVGVGVIRGRRSLRLRGAAGILGAQGSGDGKGEQRNGVKGTQVICILDCWLRLPFRDVLPCGSGHGAQPELG